MRFDRRLLLAVILLACLVAAPLARAGEPAQAMFSQSFERSNLKQLDRMTAVRLVQLIDANDANPD